jgi:hypothetical protein
MSKKKSKLSVGLNTSVVSRENVGGLGFLDGEGWRE